MEKKEIKRVFPCPVCKGKGGGTEVVIEETGEGPHYLCGYCNGEGMIEIGGKTHTRIKRESIAISAIEKFAQDDEEYSYGQIVDIGKQIQKIIEDYLN